MDVRQLFFWPLRICWTLLLIIRLCGDYLGLETIASILTVGGLLMVGISFDEGEMAIL